MEVINLVCTHKYYNLLKTIDEYQMDLGKNYTKRDDTTNTLESNIKDNFRF